MLFHVVAYGCAGLIAAFWGTHIVLALLGSHAAEDHKAKPWSRELA
jgi:hypothetical protein